MKNWLPRKGKAFWLIGLILCTISFIQLAKMPSVSEYILPSPTENEAMDEAPLAGILKRWDKQKATLTDTTLYAVKYGVPVSSGSNNFSAGVIAVEEGYFSVAPKYLLSGRFISQAEYASGAKVCLIDQQLAFALFPATEPTEAYVNIEGARYRVVGVLRHAKQIGDVDACAAYLPINAAANGNLQTEYLVMAKPHTVAGASRALKEASLELLGDGGDFFDLDKEIMRATMLARILAIVFSLVLLRLLLKKWNRLLTQKTALLRDTIKTRYFRTIIPQTCAWALVLLGGYALLALAGYGVLRLILAPLYVFPEWVPDVIVEWSSIQARVTALLADFNRPRKLQTQNVAAVRVYAFILRIGLTSALLGALRTFGRFHRRSDFPNE